MLKFYYMLLFFSPDGTCKLFLVPRTHIDDEYANASERDPKILITTSRNPSAPLTQFVKVGIVLICSIFLN